MRYFAGDIHALSGLPWRAAGTEFQREVWRALCDIPVGETISYAELARRIGRPNAVRAVGLANGANPNGLALYRLGEGAAPRLVWERSLTRWGPSRARWRDARHLIVQQEHEQDINGPQDLPPTYAELELPAAP